MAKKITVRHESSHSDHSTEEVSEVKALEAVENDPQSSVEIEPHLDTVAVKNPFKRFGAWFWRKKVYTLPVTLLVIVAILLAIPVTRYAMTSWFWRESVTVMAKDAVNGKPVSEATVTIAGQTAKTNAKGIAKLASVPVGSQQLKIEKKYYSTQTSTITVPWFAGGKEFDTSVTATGRSVPVAITDRITGKAVEGVLISVKGDNNQARTDADGKATIILPADKSDMPATITADHYLSLDAKLVQSGPNQLQLVPSGKMYFLSKLSGKIDVVRTNFDGSDRRVVLAGTGTENDNTTSLLASTDWKFLALKSKRDASKPDVLTLITTSDDSHGTFDEGNADFTLVGWSGHQFIYSVIRNDAAYWQPKRVALKTLDADSQKVAIIEENASVGLSAADSFYESIDNPYIVGDQLTYTKRWWPANYYGSGSLPTDKQASINTVRPDGINKKVIKSFAQADTSIQASLYRPLETYYTVTPPGGAPTQYFELDQGQLKTVAKTDVETGAAYPTYLISPSATKTFWSEPRDGKNALLVGDKNGENGQQLATQSDFKAFGWLTDNYLLIQKGDSELYITTADQIKAGVAPLKISDYHKPLYGIQGYGSGYGGQ